MRHWMFPAAIALSIVVGSEALGQTQTAEPKDARIAELIGKLGSPKFGERERARRELEAIGAPALEALRKAAKSSDLEISRRAGEIVRTLAEKTNTAQILAPKRVHLALKNVSVSEAVKELEKQSQYPIHLQGDSSSLARKITLDTGDTSFWEALDQLCSAAGLVEVAAPAGQPGIGAVPIPMFQPRIKLRPAPVPGVLPVVPPANPPQKGPVFQFRVPQAQAPLQVQPPPPPQAQRLQAQILQAQIQPAWRVPVPFGAPSSGPITLTPGTPKKVPTSYAGAVRVRLLPGTKKAGEADFVLDAAAEPRLQNFSLTGSPRIDRAVDSEGQTLDPIVGPMPPQARPNVPGQGQVWIINGVPMTPSTRQQTVRLKLGDKAKEIKELKGILTAQALTPSEPLITIDDVLKAAGKTAKGAQGGSLELRSIDKLANGDYQVQVSVQNPPRPNPFGMAGNIQFQQIQIRVIGGNMVVGGAPMGNQNDLPVLTDKDGKSYRLVSVPSRSMQANGAAVSQQATIVFRPQAGQGEPARLVLNGQRTVTFSVPFAFKDVPLP